MRRTHPDTCSVLVLNTRLRVRDDVPQSGCEQNGDRLQVRVQVRVQVQDGTVRVVCLMEQFTLTGTGTKFNPGYKSPPCRL